MQRRSAVLSLVLLLVLFACGAVVTARVLMGGRVPGFTRDRVGILPVVGVLDSEGRVVRQLRQLRDDPSVRALVLEIRSPGGGVGAAQSIYSALRQTREEDDLPIVAWIGDVGASGGYYVAVAADTILSLPGSITGSIGVIVELPDAQELMRKVGVKVEVVKSGPLKDMGSPFRELEPREREVLQTLVDDVFAQFVTVVSEGRNMERARVEQIADGRVVSGQRAVDIGLVDRLGSLDDAVAVAGQMAGLGEHPRTVRPTERRTTIWDLVGGAGQSRLREWLGSVATGTTGAPRLLYEWR